MDEATRESVAALLELIWTGTPTREEQDRYLAAIEAALDMRGHTPKELADWIRQDRLEIEGMMEVKTKPEEEEEIAMHYVMVTGLLGKHSGIMHPKEHKFILSVKDRLEIEKRPLSYKQREWLFSIGRKYGV